jgi:hypothetical protein
MEKIDIGSVLNHFDDTVDVSNSAVKEYGIRFITSKGCVRTMRARKNVKSPKQQLRKPLDPRGGVTWNLKRNGTMLVHDLDLDQPRAVKTATVFGFKDFKSNTWLNVTH